MRRLLALLVVAGAVAVLPARPAGACSCVAGAPPPEVVFEGVSTGKAGEGWRFDVGSDPADWVASTSRSTSPTRAVIKRKLIAPPCCLEVRVVRYAPARTRSLTIFVEPPGGMVTP